MKYYTVLDQVMVFNSKPNLFEGIDRDQLNTIFWLKPIMG
jgi:hypothetical protein